ncbi:S-layer homology domain-containing protein [Paenibacillus sp. SC116]|nr:S-layer homology domain-containing protein [Paenibacillus sp. SC116]
MVTMLMVSIPVVVGAKEAVPVLKLDTSTKYPGDAIHITGASPLSDVIVKIVRPDGTVLYYNAVKVTQGAYKDMITLPSDAMLGTYTVIVGQGGPDKVTQQTFTVAKKSDGGSGSSGGSGNGNNGGTPPAEKADITVNENGSEITAIIPSSAMNVTKVNENGASLAKVTVDKTVLSAAFEALKAKPNEGGKALVVGVTVPDQGSDVEGARVELPAGVLKDAQSIVPNSFVAIQAHGASIELPIKGINTAQLERTLNSSAADMNIVVTTRTMTSLFTEKEKQIMLSDGITKVSEPISFNIAAATPNGKQVTIATLGNNVINKTLSISSKLNIDSKKSTVVAVDPTTRKIRFVPAVFQTSVDGVTTVNIKHHAANEIYMVVSSQPAFKDTAGHWAQSSIEHLAAKQIVKGVGINSFDPNGQVTRAEFAAMLVRAAGLKDSSPLQSNVFKDVRVDDWFAGAVQTAAELGLVKGMQDGSFQPDAPISREQMAVMIDRFMKLVDTELQMMPENALALGNYYSDASHISSWAQSSMEQLVSSKLMVGLTADKLAPKEQATRAETVKILERCLRYAELIN